MTQCTPGIQKNARVAELSRVTQRRHVGGARQSILSPSLQKYFHCVNFEHCLKGPQVFSQTLLCRQRSDEQTEFDYIALQGANDTRTETLSCTRGFTLQQVGAGGETGRQGKHGTRQWRNDMTGLVITGIRCLTTPPRQPCRVTI